MKKVLVLGASRGIGLEVVRRALESGYTVRAVARSARRMTLSHPALQTFAGSALSQADMRTSMRGVDAVVLTLGMPMGLRLITGPVQLFSAATRVVLAAMAEANVRRLLCVTGFGAGESRAAISVWQRLPFALVFGRAYADKSIQEQLIAASGLKWVIARPGVLTRGAASGDYQVLTEPSSWRNGLISRADVADFLVRQIDSDQYLGQAPVLCR